MIAPSVDDSSSADLFARTQAWIAADPDPQTASALSAMVERADESGDLTELTEAMGRRLEFGTAGLRGQMGPGSNRLNRLVTRQTAAGLAAAIIEHRSAKPRNAVDEAKRAGDGVTEAIRAALANLVLIGHDARHHSEQFAHDIVDVLTAAGLDCQLVDGPNPTPLVAWGMRQIDAVAGVVVTASHNPPRDNGIKIYWSDGAQIIPPVDRWIASAIDEAALGGNPVAPPVDAVLADVTLTDDYVAMAAALATASPIADRASLTIAATSMHGVGALLLRRCLEAAGFSDLHTVGAQELPDPDFPTVAFPNPEEPGATDLLVDLAASLGADVAFANDPDADRLAVGVPTTAGWRMLTGDEVGAVFAAGLLEFGTDVVSPLFTTTVVSSQLLSAIAQAAGATFVETLTGFKWLCRPAIADPTLHQVVAYEEALGYAVAGLRDKDGITAAVVMADLVCAWKQQGVTITDVLDRLTIRHGAHLQRNFSVRIEGPGWKERLAAVAASVVASPPERLAGSAVARIDQPAPDVIRLFLDNGDRIVIRPSGTEPKLKCYCEAIEPVAGDESPSPARERASARLTQIQSDIGDYLDALS